MKTQNTYCEEYFIPLMRIVLNEIQEFKKLIKEKETEKAFIKEQKIGELSAILTETNRKTIVKIMNGLEGTRYRWIYREKKAKDEDEENE